MGTFSLIIPYAQILQKEISLAGVLTASLPSRPSKWAILLLRFNNEQNLSASAPSLDFYERLFTGKGAGTLNVPAFFSDVSHGQLDLSASKVFDWMTINANRSDYVGNIADKNVPKGKFNRNGLMALGYQTALDNKILLSDYEGIVYSFAGLIDLFGVIGGMAAVCDTGSLWPSLLGQEMSHGYGLDHSRADGSQADYLDIWDVMSTNVGGTFSTPDANYTFVGPGMNAWNMRSRGWLDESRVWKPLFVHFGTQDVVLRPLHRHDLVGYLAAELGPYLVEYRVAERWDAGLQGGSGILVHRFGDLDNHSYVMGPPAAEELVSSVGAHPQKVGETFQVGNESKVFDTVYRCEVLAINDAAHTATIRLSYRPAAEQPGPRQLPFQVGPIGSDVGGIYIQGGTVHRIPPYGPLMQIMQQITAHIEAASIRDTGVRSLTQATALTGIMRHAAEALRALDPIRTPSPAPTRSQMTSPTGGEKNQPKLKTKPK
jgi:hypothetical protein